MIYSQSITNIIHVAITYARVFLNRQSAAAHQLVFEKINAIVTGDTGEGLQWRHLHARSLRELTGILQWTGDQHGGQAKGKAISFIDNRAYNKQPPGLGLHLQALAEKLPARNDLHEPHRKISSLTPYEHLRRVFRLCHVHVERNIKNVAVPELVKNKMRSLICIRHQNFDGCLHEIEVEGGKAGAGK